MSLALTPSHLILLTVYDQVRQRAQNENIFNQVMTQHLGQNHAHVARNFRMYSHVFPNLTVKLASGAVLQGGGISYSSEGVSHIGPSSSLNLLGTHLNCSLNRIRIVSPNTDFSDVRIQEDRDGVEMSAEERKEILLHLMVDEMAFMLLDFKMIYNQKSEVAAFEQSVAVTITDTWSDQNQTVMPPFPGTRFAASSLSRYLMLTGLPSYFSQFGFNRVVSAISEPENGIDRNQLIAAYAAQRNDLKDFYKFCFDPLRAPQQTRSNSLSSMNFDRCQGRVASLEQQRMQLIKVFLPDAPVMFMGSHGQHVYPNLQDMGVEAHTAKTFFEETLMTAEYPVPVMLKPELQYVNVANEMLEAYNADLQAEQVRGERLGL